MEKVKSALPPNFRMTLTVIQLLPRPIKIKICCFFIVTGISHVVSTSQYVLFFCFFIITSLLFLLLHAWLPEVYFFMLEAKLIWYFRIHAAHTVAATYCQSLCPFCTKYLQVFNVYLRTVFWSVWKSLWKHHQGTVRWNLCINDRQNTIKCHWFLGNS